MLTLHTLHTLGMALGAIVVLGAACSESAIESGGSGGSGGQAGSSADAQADQTSNDGGPQLPKVQCNVVTDESNIACDGTQAEIAVDSNGEVHIGVSGAGETFQFVDLIRRSASGQWSEPKSEQSDGLVLAGAGNTATALVGLATPSLREWSGSGWVTRWQGTTAAEASSCRPPLTRAPDGTIVFGLPGTGGTQLYKLANGQTTPVDLALLNGGNAALAVDANQGVHALFVDATGSLRYRAPNGAEQTVLANAQIASDTCPALTVTDGAIYAIARGDAGGVLLASADGVTWQTHTLMEEQSGAQSCPEYQPDETDKAGSTCEYSSSSLMSPALSGGSAPLLVATLGDLQGTKEWTCEGASGPCSWQWQSAPAVSHRVVAGRPTLDGIVLSDVVDSGGAKISDADFAEGTPHVVLDDHLEGSCVRYLSLSCSVP